MTEYSTSLPPAQAARRARVVLDGWRRPTPAWGSRSRAASLLLLLGVVACSSPSPADRSGSAVASVPGTPAAQPAAAADGPFVDARTRPGYPARIALLLPVSGRQQLAGIAEGHTHGVALVPDNDWGQRLLRAFDAEFAAGGGQLLSRTSYDTGARDYSQPITRMRLIDESRARANALATALGTRFEFEPRSRTDAQFVFVAAQPLQGRSLRPALRFHLAQDLPVYATSDVYDPDADGNADLDGVAFPDMPWLVAPDAAANGLRASLTSFWPARSRGRGRLYAFGYDAFRLIPALRSARPGDAATAGLTGRLTVDERGQVRRELDWAEVEGGRIRARTGTGGGTLVR